MTKIVVSLRSVFKMNDRFLPYGNLSARNTDQYRVLRFY
ncbi:hypothetical protein D1AOALGA4SA_10211 [Olavius algarvensis Delta 1 endosymbiont]|nr:hypothetical protein D1AOALGA4SA_10211 [Olavius algarvensis Delta 1 endosymbiont]